MPNRPASCWVTHGAERWSVSIPQRDVPDSTVPHVLRNELILSCPTSPSKFLRRSSWATPFGVTGPAWVSTLFATSPVASTHTGEHPLPLRSAHRLSQPLDGLLRHRFCGLVSSRSHVQGFTAVQGFLPTHSLTDSSPARAPMVLSLFRSPATEAAGCRFRASHLRGVDP